MTRLAEVVKQCRQQLEHDPGMIEEAVTVRVVLPVLNALGWRHDEAHEMVPQYRTKRGNVDWALCRKGEPLVLLEVKAPNESLPAHTQQLYDYVRGSGIRLAVLTNGREWWFYRATANGEWADRRYATIDIAGPQDDGGLDQLHTFLNKSDVYSGAAYRTATKRHKRLRQESEQLPEVMAIWERMVAHPDDEFVELLRSFMQERHGINPTAQVVKRALSEAPRQGTGTPPPGAELTEAAIQGEPLKVKYWKDVLTETARWLLARRDKLPTIARPKKAALVNKSGNGMGSAEKLPHGYYIETAHAAGDCVEHARWLLEYCGFSPDDLAVRWRVE